MKSLLTVVRSQASANYLICSSLTHSLTYLFIQKTSLGAYYFNRILSSGIIIVNMTQSLFISSSFSNNMKYTYKHKNKKTISGKLISNVIIFFEFIHNLKFQGYGFRTWASIFTKIIFYHKRSLSDNNSLASY